MKGARNSFFSASVIFVGVKSTFMDDPGSRGILVAGPWFAVEEEKYAPFWNNAEFNLLV
jgi:hypothetical protein